MIVITGATSKLGKLVVDNLLTRIKPDQLGVNVRVSSKASHLNEKGVRVTQATFDDPASLRESFKAIYVAQEVGISTIRHTSHIGSSSNSPFLACQHHAETENYLEQSDLNWYSLRNGFYNESLPMMLGNPIDHGAIYAPEDGPVSWTSHADLAEAISILLTDESKLPKDNHYIPLRANEFDGIAKAISQVTGKDIKKIIISDDKFVENSIGYGLPEPVATILLGIYQASRKGEFSKVDPLLEKLLGRKPEGIQEWAKRIYG